MHMDSIIRALKLLIRVDSAIADLTFKARMSQIALLAVALTVAAFGLIMVGVAAFQFLKELWGPVLAALTVAGGSFVLALLLVAVAGAQKPGKELQLAQELHATALDALIAEAKAAGSDFNLAGNLLRGRFDSSLLALIGPLASFLLGHLKKKADKSGANG